MTYVFQMERPPTFDRGTQIPNIRSRDQVTEVERVATRDGGSQYTPVGIDREVQTHIPRTVTWTQTRPLPLSHNAMSQTPALTTVCDGHYELQPYRLQLKQSHR